MAAKNRIGETHGKLTVVARAKSDSRGNSMWECVCVCGNTSVVRGFALSTTKSCGCLSGANRAIADRSGEKHGSLTVVSRAESDSSGNAMWNCLCECGSATIVRGFALKSTKSCVCAKGESHMMYKTPEYRAWSHMLERCSNQLDDRYGARGISVCEAWKSSFTAFLHDMGLRPSNKHSIDRVDNNGNYTPDNCRWATMREQMLNTSRTTAITAFGKTQSITEWSAELGIPSNTLRNRLFRAKLAPELALVKAA